jgi:hypothetical protein
MVLAAALTVVAVLGICASAGASLLLEYADLAHERLTPAPLVPTTAPKALRPLASTLQSVGSAGRKRYSLRLVDVAASGAPKAVIAMQRGYFKSVAAAINDVRTFGGYKVRSTRVRGNKAKLFTRGRGRTRYILLVWKEKGAVYELATGTARTISPKSLRSFANGLEPLEREYVGTVCTDLCQGATAVTTTKTATVLVEWEARCTDPALSTYAGSAMFSLVPRSGDSFSLGLAATSGQPWTLNGTGTITPDAITLHVRAAGAPAGSPCDTGPLVLNLDQRFAD